MGKGRFSFTVLVLLFLTFGLLVGASWLLLSVPKEPAIEQTHLVWVEQIKFYTILLEIPGTEQPPKDGFAAGRLLAAAGFPVVAWYPGQAAAEQGQVRLEIGFSSEPAVLEPWLTRLEGAGQSGQLVFQAFPKTELVFNGVMPEYGRALLLLLNEQLRHLGRAVDFFGHDWEKLKAQQITEQRLQLLEEENRQCMDEMADFSKKYSQMAQKENFLLLQQRQQVWGAQLQKLAQADQSAEFWLAQQQAYALICQWQQLLWEIGFL